MNGLSENLFVTDKLEAAVQNAKTAAEIMFEKKEKDPVVFRTVKAPKQVETVNLREGLAMAGG